ncbi:MAG: heme ABC exporter ATP-binding protein CcmA [Pseudomonadota bacterium]
MELTIQDLAARRGGRAVFSGLSAHVAAGQALVVTGPNGAGKSTLLRVVAGFLPPERGKIVLSGVAGGDVARTPGALQEHLAYTGHLDAVKPALAVAENLALWAGLHGAGPERVAAALDHFGLRPLAGRQAGECSAGQKRRLGLARLMVTDRPVWLMDEPTASLDTAAAAQVSALVRGHCEKGGIAVIATHLDLGLDNAVPLAMTGTEGAGGHAPAAEDDPFLAGAW